MVGKRIAWFVIVVEELPRGEDRHPTRIPARFEVGQAVDDVQLGEDRGQNFGRQVERPQRQGVRRLLAEGMDAIKATNPFRRPAPPDYQNEAVAPPADQVIGQAGRQSGPS